MKAGTVFKTQCISVRPGYCSILQDVCLTLTGDSQKVVRTCDLITKQYNLVPVSYISRIVTWLKVMAVLSPVISLLGVNIHVKCGNIIIYLYVTVAISPHIDFSLPGGY